MVTGAGEPASLRHTEGVQYAYVKYSICSAFDLLHYKGVDIERLLPRVCAPGPALHARSPAIIERVGIAGK